MKEDKNIKIILADYKKRIDMALEIFFDKKIENAELDSSKDILINLKEFNLRGGKRIRPIFMIKGYECFNDKGGKDEELISASIAIELMEGFFLVHDDILDQDTIRRGGPTFHERYRKRCEKSNMGCNPQRYGENMAILAGDLQSVFVNNLIIKSEFSEEVISKALELYFSAVERTIYGCIEEHELNSSDPLKVKEEEVMQVNKLKTASYTVEFPLRIGAALAGANDNDMNILSSYAVSLGQAFQLQDDILGMFGDETKTGKPVGSDLREGKVTLLIVKALELSSGEDQQELLSVLGKSDLSEDEINKAREIIESSGSLKYSRDLAKNLVLKSKKIIEDSNFNESAKDFLIEIGDYIVERER